MILSCQHTKRKDSCGVEEIENEITLKIVGLQTCAGAVILTDVVFWSIIVPLLSNSHLRLNLVRDGFPFTIIVFTRYITK